MKLTAKIIERMKHDPVKGQQYDVKDDDARGLYVRLSESGYRAFAYRYKLNGRRRVIILGEIAREGEDTEMRKARGHLTLAEARDRAFGYARMVREGEDPGASLQRHKAERRAMPTVEEFGAEYIERHAKPNKRTWKDDQENLKNWVYPEIGRLKLTDVRRLDITAVLDKVHAAGYRRAPGTVLAVVRKMFNFAIERGVLESSPCTHIREKQPEAARKAMTEAQIKTWWQATGEALIADKPIIQRSAALALRLLLLTGQRPGEVAGLRIEELRLDEPEDGPAWHIPSSRRKHGKAHAVALCPLAVETIQAALPYAVDGYLFRRERHYFRSTGTPCLRTDSGLLEPLGKVYGSIESRPTPHSARHTVATELKKLKYHELEIALVLGHQATMVTGRHYIEYSGLARQRELLEAWERRLVAVVVKQPGTAQIIPLAATAA